MADNPEIMGEQAETPAPQSAQEYLNQMEGASEEPQQQEEEQREEAVEPQTNEPTEEPRTYADKFKSVEDLEKSYLEAQKVISKQGQEKSELKKLAEEYQAKLAEFEERKQPETPEEPIENPEEWLDKFYRNPKEALQELIDSRAKELVNPLQEFVQTEQQQRQWLQKIEEVKSKHPDFENLTPQITEVLDENPGIEKLPNAVEIAYNLAKARQAKSPEELLQDENFINDLLQNENVKSKVLQGVSKNLQTKTPPTVIGNQSGHPAAAPEEKPKTFKEAKRAAMEFLGGFTGKG